jgi:O-antigen ligase
MAIFPGIATFIFETLTWQTGSSASHLKDWVNGVTAFLEQPWGYGLGTTDQTAVRVGLTPLTADNLYLKYAVELGAPGLIALLGTLGGIALAGARAAKNSVDQAGRDLGAAVLVITLGVFVYGMTSTMFNDPIVGYMTFWLGGTAVTLAQRSALPNYKRTMQSAIGYA